MNWVRGFCLHGDGLEEVECSLLLGIGRGRLGESGGLWPQPGTATEIGDDPREIVQQRAEGMNDGVVVELFGLDLLKSPLRAFCWRHGVA